MNARELLEQTPLFAGFDAAALDRLAAQASLVDVRSGALLFGRGHPSDYLYIVATGRLRATLADGRRTDLIVRLQPAGEISVVLGETHTADVYAVRDSVLLRLPAPTVLEAFQQFPAALLRLTRLIEIGRAHV